MTKKDISSRLIFTIGFFLFIGMAAAVAQDRNERSEVFRPFALKYYSPFANPAADLDQCANGGVGGPAVICSGAAWQNGNLGQSQAHYLEGDSVPYRLRFSNLDVGSVNTVTIEYDTTENSGKHALDCLTGFERTETTADPCSGVTDCSLATKDTFAIPPDANFTAGFDGINGTTDDIPAMPGDFSLFNGDITGVSGYTMSGTYAGGSQTRITVTFIANTTNPVLAWGGHISTRVNWGTDNSAIAISGSPYHMRLVDLNGAGGNQDRSLSSAATLFPGQVTLIKDARPNTSQVFGFTATGPGLSNFALVDDGTTLGATQAFGNLTSFGIQNAMTITEGPPTNFYTLTQINCVENASGGPGLQNSTVDIPNRRANLILEEGEAITCTFINATPTASLAMISGRVTDISGNPVRGVMVEAANLSSGGSRYAVTNQLGYFRMEDLQVGEAYLVSVSSKRYGFIVDSRVLLLTDDFTGVDFTAMPLE